LVRLLSKASNADLYPWSSFHNLVVTNSSARGRPLESIARPTAISLPYRAAVSILRYPASIAVDTADTVSSSGTRKTPKPICGIAIPLFSGIAVQRPRQSHPLWRLFTP
jgi:hypothetical protein